MTKGNTKVKLAKSEWEKKKKKKNLCSQVYAEKILSPPSLHLQKGHQNVRVHQLSNAQKAQLLFLVLERISLKLLLRVKPMEFKACGVPPLHLFLLLFLLNSVDNMGIKDEEYDEMG